MKCSLCECESDDGVKGPNGLYLCRSCIESAGLNSIDATGECSWCGERIGKTKGIFKKRTIKAVAVNDTEEIILCNECAEYCKDIVHERTKA
jgi:hypothetical protein